MCSLWQTKLTNSLGKQQLDVTTCTDQVMHLETAANFCASQPQACIFFAICVIFELGSITKHCMTGSKENSM